MKTMMKLLAALLIAVIMMTSAALAAGPIQTEGSVNVRKGAGLEYDRTTAMAKSDTARYLGETKKDSRGVAWYKVDWNGKTGWVSSRYTRKAKY